MNKKIKTLFIIYMIILIWIILFKLSINIGDMDTIRKINLRLFYYEDNVTFQVMEVIENIIIFIPMGIMLKCMGVNTKKSVLIGFITSFILEMMQYILAIGVSDITDIVTNTSGVIIGSYIYMIILMIFKNREIINNIVFMIGCILFSMFMMFYIMIMIVN